MELFCLDLIVSDILSFLFLCSDEYFLDVIEYLFQLLNYQELFMLEEVVVEQINEFLLIDNLLYYVIKKVWIDYKGIDRFGNELKFSKLGEFVRVVCKESEILYQNVIIFMLSFLRGEGLNNVNLEFFGVLKDYRYGNYRDVLIKSNSVFESMMKVICLKRKYKYFEYDVFNKFFKMIIENFDFDLFWEQLIQIILIIRNCYSLFYGVGIKLKEVLENICNFVINMMVFVMIFLDEKFLKSKR